MFCKNIACLTAAREHYRAVTQLHSLVRAKRAIFIQNILKENYSKFYLKQYSLKQFLKILYFCMNTWKSVSMATNTHVQ